ncbi:MAG TPA: hypothetical protein VMD27_11400 [Candidatus Aquilonibacter sp.]|nr:hypothetical protein [Candidatus Aquilonibacter sp.]
MGSVHGEIRGESKIDVYLKYVDEIKKWDGVFDEHFPDAKYKKVCKNLMEQDPNSGEWVLRYRFHT